MISFDLETPRGDYPDAQIGVGRYPQARPDDPLQIGWSVTSADGEPLGNPTVNLWSPPVFPAPGCVWIKITPEFSGWLGSLERAGLIEPTGRIAPSGFVAHYAAECRVLVSELLRPTP